VDSFGRPVLVVLMVGVVGVVTVTVTALSSRQVNVVSAMTTQAGRVTLQIVELTRLGLACCSWVVGSDEKARYHYRQQEHA
jgi:hypothetical protein